MRVKIPHSLFDSETDGHSICLFCRSEDKEGLEAYLQANPIPGVTKVVSINQLRKLYVAFKDRRELLGQHTHFVSDVRVLNQLYNLLGKVFGARNNYPVPVEFEKFSELEKAVKKVQDSTYMHLKGQNISLRIGHTNMSARDIADNVRVGMEFAIQKLPKGAASVHSLHLKSSDSAALPLFSRVASQMLDFVKAQVKEDEVIESHKVEVAPASTKGGKKAGSKAGSKAVAVSVAAKDKAEKTVTATSSLASRPVVDKKGGKKADAVAAPPVVAEVAKAKDVSSTGRDRKKKAEAVEEVVATKPAPRAKRAAK